MKNNRGFIVAISVVMIAIAVAFAVLVIIYAVTFRSQTLSRTISFTKSYIVRFKDECGSRPKSITSKGKLLSKVFRGAIVNCTPTEAEEFIAKGGIFSPTPSAILTFSLRGIVHSRGYSRIQMWSHRTRRLAHRVYRSESERDPAENE